MTITTLFFGTQRVEAVPSTAIKLVTGAGEALGGRATRIRYHILVKTQSGKTLKPGFREFDFQEINRNIKELALLMGVAWAPCEEYVFDPD